MTQATDPHALLYSQLDPEEAKALTARLLAPCDDGELYLQFMASESDCVRCDPGTFCPIGSVNETLCAPGEGLLLCFVRWLEDSAHPVADLC